MRRDIDMWSTTSICQASTWSRF